MHDNPYSNAISRYFEILLGVAGSALFAYLAIHSISIGSTAGIGRYSRIFAKSYTLATTPSQFWLMVLFYLVAGSLFALLAWRAYRR